MHTYLPLFRKIEENPVWEDNTLLSIWIRLLIKANHSEGKWWNGNKLISIKPGQFVTSGPKLSAYLRLPRTTAMRKLKILIDLEMVDMEVDKQYTTVTICNYKYYQSIFKGRGQVSGQRTDSERTQVSKNYKELINKPSGVDDQIWNDWVLLRKKKRAPITETALDIIVKQAGKAGISLSDALSECCARGWAGFKADWYLSKDKQQSQGKTVRTYEDEQ